jgi:2-polyprenyl-3-methyl-5-hydroxy-6-metoxy-1,4-benzoquinol methylase
LKKVGFAYTGCDNLEAMSEAVKYNNYLTNQVIKVVNRLNTSKTQVSLLDFGAGSGTYSDLLKKSGLKTECLEPDFILQDVLRKKGYFVYESTGKVRKKYDVIFSLNVLEHIADDTTSLKEQYKLIKPDGYVFVYVPAFQALFSSMDKKVEHYRRY